MKKILLTLSTTRQSSKAINYALKIAGGKKAELIILFILDPDLPQFVFDKMMDVGFMGDSPTKQLFKSIQREYKERGQKIIEEISHAAESLEIACRTVMIEGGFVKECLRIITEERPELAILTRADRSNLSRFLFGSAVNQLKQKSPCPIKVIKEE
jgi:nucleotide-binding universal stress UspA family protein